MNSSCIIVSKTSKMIISPFADLYSYKIVVDDYLRDFEKLVIKEKNIIIPYELDIKKEKIRDLVKFLLSKDKIVYSYIDIGKIKNVNYHMINNNLIENYNFPKINIPVICICGNYFDIFKNDINYLLSEKMIAYGAKILSICLQKNSIFEEQFDLLYKIYKSDNHLAEILKMILDIKKIEHKYDAIIITIPGSINNNLIEENKIDTISNILMKILCPDYVIFNLLCMVYNDNYFENNNMFNINYYIMSNVMYNEFDFGEKIVQKTIVLPHDVSTIISQNNCSNIISIYDKDIVDKIFSDFINCFDSERLKIIK